MKISQLLNEVSTPTGAIFIRFKEKVGAVSANPQRGERSEATYLTAYAGFANAPEDLQQGNALRNFNSINSAEDIVSMIKAIFTDKVFLSVKSLTIYDDFTKPMQGDSSPIYKRHPFLLKFMKWVEREGGDQIKIADKVSQEGPPKIKRPRKENPNKGRKIRDIPQGETKKTVTFTVGPRFYKQAQRDLPNLMKYRGPNGTFIMPNELFMQFRAQAEKTYPYAEIKLINRVATGENIENEGYSDSFYRDAQRGGMSRAEDKGYYDGLAGRYRCPYPNGTKEQEDYDHGYSNGREYSGDEDDDENFESRINEGSDKSAHDCGIADGYYGRPPNPYKIEMGKRVKLTDPAEIADYMAGYNDDSVGSKVYESEDPMDKDARDSYGRRAPGVKKLKDGTYHAVNDAGEHKIFKDEAAAKRHAHKTDEGKWNYPKDIKGGASDDDYYLGTTNRKREARKEFRKAEKAKAHKELMTKKKTDEGTMTDESLNERSTSEKQARTMAAAAHDPKFAKKVGIKTSVAKEFNKADKGTKQLSNAMKKEDGDYSKDLDKKLERLSPNLMSRYKNKNKNRQQVEDDDPMVKNLPPINLTGGSQERTNALAAMATSQPAKPAPVSQADKRAATTLESKLVDIEDDSYWLMERGKASRAFCKANARKRGNMGASQLSSCISQGYLSHKSGKSVKVANRRIKLDGVKMKGEKYGGPKSTKAGE